VTFQFKRAFFSLNSGGYVNLASIFKPSSSPKMPLSNKQDQKLPQQQTLRPDEEDWTHIYGGQSEELVEKYRAQCRQIDAHASNAIMSREQLMEHIRAHNPEFCKSNVSYTYAPTLPLKRSKRCTD
jgi:hypothetical protein